VSPKPHPRDFEDLPATRRRNTCGHPVAALADELGAHQVLNETSGVPDRSGIVREAIRRLAEETLPSYRERKGRWPATVSASGPLLVA